MSNLNKIKKEAKDLGLECVYNRSTGCYQIKRTMFTFSEGVYPYKNGTKNEIAKSQLEFLRRSL